MKITVEYRAELDDIEIREEAARLIKERLVQKINKSEQNSLLTEVKMNE